MTLAQIEDRVVGAELVDLRTDADVVSLYFKLEAAYSKDETAFAEVRGRVGVGDVIMGGQIHYLKQLPVSA